jgi:hypothetical protein
MTRSAVGRAAWSLGLLLAALSLAPSYAHLLEAPPRLQDWPARLWIEATVRHGQFVIFRNVGGPIDVAAVLGLVGLAILERRSRRFAWTLAGAVLFALALGVWFAVVAPANTVLATWSHGPAPTRAAFAAVRDRWESGHAIAAALKLTGFLALALAVTGSGERRRAGRPGR